MSGDPWTLLTGYLAAGDGKDYKGLRGCVAEQVVAHSPGGTRSVGVDALERSWRAAHRGLRDLRHEVQDGLGAGDLATAQVVASGVHAGPFLGVAASGTVLRVEQALFVRVVGTRIVELWEVVDTGAGLRQLGLLGGQPLAP